jgi:hypothetical protein
MRRGERGRAIATDGRFARIDARKRVRGAAPEQGEHHRVYRALRRRAGRFLNAFPAFKRALKRIERAVLPGLSTPPAVPPPVAGAAVDPVRRPRAERVLRDLHRERRRRGESQGMPR